MSTLEAHDVVCRLGGRVVLDGVTVAAAPGRVLALIGPNGAGKSTLLATLAGDIIPASGHVLLDGKNLTHWAPVERARRRSMLLQSNAVTFGFTAREVIAMGRAPWEPDPEADDRAVADAIEATDVAHLRDRPYRQLSGGEQARVSLARVLAQQTPIVLLDEPTAALDLRHQEDTMRVARTLADEGRTVVIALHDLSLAAAYADDIAVIDSGRIVAQGGPRDVFVTKVLERTFQTPLVVLTDPNGNAVVAHRRRPRPPIHDKATSQENHMVQSIAEPTARAGASLSLMMRDGSAAEHKDAETSAFMTELLDSNVNAVGYATYLVQLRVVYEVLERVGRSLSGDPAARVVLDPNLDRVAALDADIAYWSAVAREHGHAGGFPVSAAASAYAARVEATASAPVLYVAHHYTRYLGDLSGGQAIGHLLTRHWELSDGVGVAFYEFANIPKPKPYKDAYRARLDGLDLDDVTKQRVVTEVKLAFRLNQDLFDGLSQDLGRYLRHPTKS
jgi:iron complex transport system ATP-binding protein